MYLSRLHQIAHVPNVFGVAVKSSRRTDAFILRAFGCCHKNMQIEKLKQPTCRCRVSEGTTKNSQYATSLETSPVQSQVSYICFGQQLCMNIFCLTLLNTKPTEHLASRRRSSAANLGNAIPSLGRLDLVIQLLAGSWYMFVP